MRDFGSKRSTTWSRNEQAAAPSHVPGKRTLTEMLPAVTSDAPVQGGMDADPAPRPVAPRPTIEDLFGAVQRRATGGAECAAVQCKVAGANAGDAGVPPLAPAGGGAPLAAPARSRMEALFGHSFSAVRIHEGPEAVALGAQAFTRGNHIYFAPGQYAPDTPAGRELLGHELAHVVQQRAGRVARPVRSAVNTDASLEAEADAFGTRAAHAEHGPTTSAAPSGSETAPADGPIQCVQKEEVDQLVLDDQHESRQAQGLDGVKALRNGIKAKLGEDAGGCLQLLEIEGIEAWPLDFTKLLTEVRRTKGGTGEIVPLLDSALAQARMKLEELADLIGKAASQLTPQLLIRYGFDKLRTGVERYLSEQPKEALEDYLRRIALETAPTLQLDRLGEVKPPKYTPVEQDRNVIDSSERTREHGAPMKPNDYIHRHFTPATMTFLLDHTDVDILVLEGTVNDLLAHAKSLGFASLTRLEDNAQTDFAKYIAHAFDGRAALIVLAASGEAYRRELLAHFTHYDGKGRTIDPRRIQLLMIDPERTEEEFVAALDSIGQVDALVLGKVDEFGEALMKKRKVGPLRVVRTTTPPLFGKVYLLGSTYVLSLQIEPGLYAGRAGAFLRVLLARCHHRVPLLFTGTSGAVDQNLQVNDLIAPKQFSQVDGLERELAPPVENEALGVLDELRQTPDTREPPSQGRLPNVFVGVEHGSVESILLEDNGWLKTHQQLHIVEQEIASLLRVVAKDTQRIRLFAFCTVSDVLGKDSFAQTEQHQTGQTRFKPGEVLVTGLERMLGLGNVEEPGSNVSDGRIQSEIGVGVLGETAKQMRAKITPLRNQIDKLAKPLIGKRRQPQTDQLAREIRETEQQIAQLSNQLALVVATTERIERLIAIRDEITQELAGLLGELRKLHPKQAKVIESQVHDQLITLSSESFEIETARRAKNKDFEPNAPDQENKLRSHLKAQLLEAIIGVLQRHGTLVSDLCMPLLTGSSSTKELL